MPLHFAYGSNMDRAAMAARCPASRPLGLARLERHRLVLMREGYVSVLRDGRRAVHGLLWDVAMADVPALDRYEEVAGGLYVKRHLPVTTERGPRGALVYLGTNAGPGAPRPGHLEAVLAAARSIGLPASALADIAALGPTGGGAREAAPVVERPAVRPTRRTPLDRPRPAAPPGWRWTP